MENVLYILFETLKAMKKLEDLPEFIDQCFQKEFLYYSFTQDKSTFIPNDSDACIGKLYLAYDLHRRILPQISDNLQGASYYLDRIDENSVTLNTTLGLLVYFYFTAMTVEFRKFTI